MGAALVVRGLSRSFGAVRAVAGVSLEVQAGHVHSLIGPNGDGDELWACRASTGRCEQLLTDAPAEAYPR